MYVGHLDNYFPSICMFDSWLTIFPVFVCWPHG